MRSSTPLIINLILFAHSVDEISKYAKISEAVELSWLLYPQRKD